MSYLKELFTLDGKIAIVTGASRGIGKGIAEALLRAGATVIAISANADRLANTTEDLSRLGSRVAGHRCDLTDQREIVDLIDTIRSQQKRLDVIVNCAGTTAGQDPLTYPDDAWQKTFAIHVDAPFRLARGLAELMKSSGGGSIINITSINAEQAFPDNPAYVAAKGALKQLTKSLALDLGPLGIRVNSLGPGYFRTDMTQGSWNDLDQRAQRSENTILGRWGEPSDLAGAVILLASNASSYITGQEFYVDGGWLAKGL